MLAFRVEDLGSKIGANWQVVGDASEVRAYQIEQKAVNDLDWRAASNYLLSNPNQERYSEKFDRSSLVDVSNPRIRVRAIGADGKAIAVSEPATLKTTCKSKESIAVIPCIESKFVEIEQVPKDVTLIRLTIDSTLLRWSYPEEPTAECGLYFLISGTIDSASIQQIVDGNVREHRFEGNPAKNWQLRIGAANRLGVGQSSAIVPFHSNAFRNGTILV